MKKERDQNQLENTHHILPFVILIGEEFTTEFQNKEIKKMKTKHI